MKVLGFIIAAGLMAPVALGCNLKVGFEQWPPYQVAVKKADYKAGDVLTGSSMSGLDIELGEAIAKKLKCSLGWMDLPWKRHLHLVKEGEVDIALAASFTKERAAYAHFSESYRNEVMTLFVRSQDKSRFNVKSFEDLEKASELKIGVSTGYFYGDRWKAFAEKHKTRVDNARTDELNITKLRNGRVGGIIVDPFAFRNSVENMQGAAVADFSKVMDINNAGVFIMLSKKSKNLSLKDLNGAINALKADGTLQSIIDKYL